MNCGQHEGDGRFKHPYFFKYRGYAGIPAGREKLLALIDKGYTFAVNAIIISEMNYKLQKILNGQEAHIRTKKLLHSRYFEYFPIGNDTMESAIDLSYASKIRINDAVIAQHCLDLGLGGIFTDNVKDFKKISGLPIINLRDKEKLEIG